MPIARRLVERRRPCAASRGARARRPTAAADARPDPGLARGRACAVSAPTTISMPQHNAGPERSPTRGVLRALEAVLARRQGAGGGGGDEPEVAAAAPAAPPGWYGWRCPRRARRPRSSPRRLRPASARSAIRSSGSRARSPGSKARLAADPPAAAAEPRPPPARRAPDRPRPAAARARRFAINPTGIVLASMFSERSRSENLALAEAARRRGPRADRPAGHGLRRAREDAEDGGVARRGGGAARRPTFLPIA